MQNSHINNNNIAFAIKAKTVLCCMENTVQWLANTAWWAVQRCIKGEITTDHINTEHITKQDMLIM